MRKIHPMRHNKNIHSHLLLVILTSLAFVGLQIFWLVSEYRSLTRETEYRMDSLLGEVTGRKMQTDEEEIPSAKAFYDISIFSADSASRGGAKVLAGASKVFSIDIKDGDLVEIDTKDGTMMRVDTLLGESGAVVEWSSTFDKDSTGRAVSIITKTLRKSWVSGDISADYSVMADGKIYTIRLKGQNREFRKIMGFVLVSIVSMIVVAMVIWSFWKLLRRIEEEQNAQKRNEQYFFGLIHDLKTPLSYTHALLDKLGHSFGEKPQVLEKINHGNLQVAKVIDKVDELLAIPRLTHIHEEDYGVCYLEDIIDTIEGELIHTYTTQDITFEHSFTEGIRYILPIRQTELILRILLDNAVRYSGTTPRITIQAESTEDYLQILISDNGGGLPTDKQRMIIKNETIQELASSQRGNGIGLMTICRLMEAMKTTLRYEKTADGSRFSFSVPQKRINP